MQKHNLKTIGEIENFPVVMLSGVIVICTAIIMKRTLEKDRVNVSYCIPELPSCYIDTDLAALAFGKAKEDIYKWAFSHGALMGAY